MREKIKPITRCFLLLSIVLFVFTVFPACTHTVQAKAVSTVKFRSAENRYYLYKPDGALISKAGLYSLRNKTANKHTFNGIYYVSEKGIIRTGPGVNYVPATAAGGQNYLSGYYYFGKGGKLPAGNGVAYLKNKRIHRQTFNGYYYYNALGKINATELGLVYLNCKASNGKSFKGYYYRNVMSALNVRDTIRNITLKNGSNSKFPGYRYFDKAGRMVTTLTSHKLNLTYKGKKYQGYYCFAGTDGKLVRKKGLITVGDVYYYVTDTDGKCLTGVSKKIDGFSYKFKASGEGRRTSTKLGSLNSRLSSMIKGYSGTWSVYVKRLDNNDSVTINDTSLYAASIIKPFVMASTYNQIHNGVIKETASITSLNRSMITVSSNDAFNELVRRQTGSYSFSAGRAVINNYLSKNNYTKTKVHHTLHPAGGALITDGGSNCTSVKDCGRLLESIYRGTCVDKSSSKKMLNYLLAQQRRWKIPAGLPAGTKVANKTGETSSSDHDIAIVYGPKCTYIICIMSKNAPYSSGRIGQISRTVYNYLN